MFSSDLMLKGRFNSGKIFNSQLRITRMNLGNFTIKAAEAVQQAQQIAFNAHNPNIETEHILKALLEQEDSPVEYLLKKNNVTVNLLESKLQEAISKLPTTTREAAQSISR